MTPARLRLLLPLNLLVFFVAANWIIVDKELQLKTGRRVLLEVTKYDPRSLLQGDYMALTYPICREIEAQLDEGARGDGLAVLSIDESEVGHFRRLHGGEPLDGDEILLRYRIRQSGFGNVRVAAEEFLFQEGMAEEFLRTRYAELRVSTAGDTLLVALCDEQRRRIGEKSE